MKNKLQDYAEKTENMFSSQADYTHDIEGNIISIIDEGGMKSVTNDIVNIINDLIECEGLLEVINRKIIYRDSSGTWDGAIPTFDSTTGKCTQVKFYPITETEYSKAKLKVR